LVRKWYGPCGLNYPEKFGAPGWASCRRKIKIMRTFIVAGLAILASTVAAAATPIAGTYTITDTGTSTITGINPINLDLTLNVAQAVNLGTIKELADGTPTIKVSFNFTAPVSATASATANDTFSTPGNSAHDAISWLASALIVNFSDGAALKIVFSDQTYNGNASGYAGLAATATFTLLQAPRVAAQVPEPVTLSIFGAGLIGAAAMRRRKKKSA
jgi:hypothetical protein